MDIESPISFGESPWSEVVPMPSCPFELSPQQATSALSRRAQVKSSPAVICTAVLPVGRETCTRLSPIPRVVRRPMRLSRCRAVHGSCPPSRTRSRSRRGGRCGPSQAPWRRGRRCWLSELHRQWGGVAGLVGRVPDEGGVTEAELAHGVVTPACDVLVVENGAGVPLAGLDVDDVPSGRHGEVWERLAGLEVAVPEPVEVIVPYAYESGLPPALHGPVLEQCAAVALAERGLRYVQRDPCVHEWQLIAHLVCLVPMSCVLPIPSWPMSPAPQHFIRSPSSSVVEVPTTHVWLRPTSKTDSLRCRSLFPVCVSAAGVDSVSTGGSSC